MESYIMALVYRSPWFEGPQLQYLHALIGMAAVGTRIPMRIHSHGYGYGIGMGR